MKKKHSYRFLILAVLMIALLAGCGKKKPAESASNTPQQEASAWETSGTPTATPAPNASSESTAATPASNTSSESISSATSSDSSSESAAVTQETDVSESEADPPDEETDTGIRIDGSYTSKEEVAEYLHLYGRLPDNFLTKQEATELGWIPSEGNLHEVAPGMSIGGDRFGNYEKLLPKGSYKECDINYDGGRRGAERIVFSDDGRIYYTGDHYNSFEQLYGPEGKTG